jgi:hypothetical protein
MGHVSRGPAAARRGGFGVDLLARSNAISV